MGKDDAPDAREAGGAVEDPAGAAPAAEGAAGEAPADGTSTATGEAEPDHGHILQGLRAHLTATAEKHDRPIRPDELRDDADLFEEGYLDSLMASEFLVLAEKEFGVPLPDWLIGGKANTLEGLARYVADELASK